jgi:hypothetical protein
VGLLVASFVDREVVPYWAMVRFVGKAVVRFVGKVVVSFVDREVVPYWTVASFVVVL